AVQIGHTFASNPAATPANATCPMPSPMSDMRFCTRNVPISGAHAPTTSPAASASCMYSRSNGHGRTRAPSTFMLARSRPSGPGRPGPGHCSAGSPPHDVRSCQTLEPEGQVVAVHAEAHAPFGEILRLAVEHDAVLQHDDPVEIRCDRAQLVRHQQH